MRKAVKISVVFVIIFALIVASLVLLTIRGNANSYEKRVERVMPKIQEVVSQYLMFYQSNKEIFDRFEDIVNAENIAYCYIRFDFTAGVEYLVYSNEKVVEEPHGRIKTIAPELFQAYSSDLFEFGQQLLKPDEFPFCSILKDDEVLGFDCIPIINREVLGISFMITKNDTDKYSGMEDLGDGWQISWKIMGLA